MKIDNNARSSSVAASSSTPRQRTPPSLYTKTSSDPTSISAKRKNIYAQIYMREVLVACRSQAPELHHGLRGAACTSAPFQNLETPRWQNSALLYESLMEDVQDANEGEELIFARGVYCSESSRVCVRDASDVRLRLLSSAKY
jgi:hypothetical protein